MQEIQRHYLQIIYFILVLIPVQKHMERDILKFSFTEDYTDS